jgi:hypothetical protein
MRPRVPASPVLTALRDMSHEERQAEISKARGIMRAWDHYLSWLQMGDALATEFEAIENGVEPPEDADVRLVLTQSFRDVKRRMHEITHEQIEITPPEQTRPVLRQGIKLVMATNPAKVWKKSEIMDALKRRGWEPKGTKPSSQLATRFAEMIEKDELVRVAVGHYRLPTPDDLDRAAEARDQPRTER